MAKKRNPNVAGGGKEPKDWRKARENWRALEREINDEFNALVTEGYDIQELETLRWDYRYEKLPGYKLRKEHLEYFVAEAEALAAGLPLPPKPGQAATPGLPVSTAGPVPAVDASGQYKRKSDVDVELIEKYLEKRITREARNDFASAYKEAFGEDLHVPENLDLVDMSYSTREIAEADRAVKLSKAEVFGLPEEAKPEEKKEEAPAIEAAPVAEVKRESSAAAAVLAFRRGIPPGPTRDEKWSVWNPFRFWLIPKRLAGNSLGRYYVFLIINLVVFLGQFILLLIPFAIRLFVWGIGYLYKRFVRPKLTPALQTLKQKAAIPPPETKAGTKSS